MVTTTRRALGMTLAAATAMVMQMGMASPAAAVPSCNPLGAWNVTVGYEGASFTAKITYQRPNVAILSDGPPPGGKGAGSWSLVSTAPCSFKARIQEIESQNGQYLGRIDIRYTAVITGNTYTSTGTSTAYDAAGAVLRTVSTNQTATRSS